MYAAELKRIYDKAYAHRTSIIRQEDLLQRFLMGLEDNKARVHIELSKDPKTIEEAVQLSNVLPCNWSNVKSPAAPCNLGSNS
jgi:hypothetical protein